jgi:anti-sigma regulatory factor (Ser/Thr protein kinase)
VTARDVELAQAAVEAARHHREVARRNAAEARAASIAVTRAGVNHRAVMSGLATDGRWQVPATQPLVVAEPAGELGSTVPESELTEELPLQRRPLDVEHSPRMSARYVLVADRSAPTQARRLIRSKCWHLPNDRLETAVLLTSELVTNAVVHSEGGVRLAVDMADETLRVVVSDGGRGEVRVADDFHWPESGHGLRIVDALSTHWGVNRVDGAAKSVWFELPL